MKLHCLWAVAAVALLGGVAAETTAAPTVSAPLPALSALPGRGLDQHPFLYCGEYDTRKPVQTMVIVRGGKVVWSYSIPTNDAQGVLQEFDDVTLLRNGNVVYSRKTGASEVTPDKKIVWNYDCPPGTECHSAQPVSRDHVLIMRNGDPAQLMLFDTKTNTLEKTLTVPTGNPANTHGQFRHVRLTPAGTFLVPHMDMDKVSEYDGNGKEIWSVPAKAPWAAVRLRSGNTLISGNGYKYVREVNPAGRTVWELTQADVPDIPLLTIQGVQRLANGDTVVCNWVSGGDPQVDWPRSVQVFEVTPAKKVVWALRQWQDPDLGTASGIQLLDEKGDPEKLQLQR